MLLNRTDNLTNSFWSDLHNSYVIAYLVLSKPNKQNFGCLFDITGLHICISFDVQQTTRKVFNLETDNKTNCSKVKVTIQFYSLF